jgi:hypothetical protein
MSPGSDTEAVGTVDTPFTPEVTYGYPEGCSSYEAGPYTPGNGSWFSRNSTVASVDPSSGQLTYNGAGSADIVFTWSEEGYESDGLECIDEGPLVYSVDGTATGKPTITSINPAKGLIAATTSSVTLMGRGFSGGHINTPPGIEVANITTSTDTKIVMDLVVASTATLGNNSVSITVSGEDSNSVNFFVQVPTGLSIVPGTATGTERPCTSSACGTIVSFRYQVNDQATQPINAVMSFWDSFGTFSPDPLGMNSAPLATTCTFNNQINSGPCGRNTDSSGQFQEAVLGACSTVCKVNGVCATGGPSNVNQTWHIASSNIVQQISERCEKVLVNGVQP